MLDDCSTLADSAKPAHIDRTELAARLTAAEDQAALLSRYARLADIGLARALKAIFDKSESSDPARAINAAAALELVANLGSDPELHAWADWTAGMAAQLEGRLDESVARLG